MSPTKSCMVCGDKALGYNFNAVTCESCKAFFRRNALAKKQFTCPFNQNCEITVVTRRFCQKCRLKKCIGIGMKSENIMSEEDKLIKRRKIENNRAKRKEHIGDNVSLIKAEAKLAADSSGILASDTYDSQSCSSFDSARDVNSSNKDCGITSVASVDNLASTVEVSAVSMTGAEIVEFIVCDPDRATEAINKLMRNPREALFTIEKVINSPSDALRLISHLISYPGNALKIISKIMNSPFDALTVFTKFMSSPTDAIEIISKIVSSPKDVLTFVKQLMDSPEDALNIMNKFMDTPAEALKIINKMVNGSNSSQPVALEDSTFPVSYIDVRTSPPVFDGGNALIHSMLIRSPISAENELLSVPASTHDVHVPAVFPSSLHFHSPPKPRNELSGTSGELVVDNDLSTENITKFIQNSSPDNADSINSLDSVLTKVICIEYQSFNALSQETCLKQEHGQMKQHFLPTPQQPVCAPSSIIMGHDLNEAELLKLRELKIASEALYYPVDEDLNELVTDDVGIKSEDTHQDPKLLQVINLTAVAIKRLIKMAKKITAFRDLCQEDQVAVLKGGCIEMMIMRSVMTYDDNRNAWKIPHTKEGMSNIRADVLKLAKGNVYEEHLRFIRTFDEKWRMDENIILIMCAIILLTPSRPRVIHSDVIRLEQNSYYYLLRRYLESIYPGCEAKSALIKLIQKISDVEHLNQFMIGVYLNVNPSLVEPLLREIFDMKNH